MSVTISIKTRKEVVDLADRMVKYGIAKSRSHAFNILIEKGIGGVIDEVRLWDRVYEKAEELEAKGYELKHGSLWKILEEGRIE